jgi:hypothetical protein
VVVGSPDAPIGVGLDGDGIQLRGKKAFALMGAKKNCHMGRMRCHQGLGRIGIGTVRILHAAPCRLDSLAMPGRRRP